MCGRYKRKSDKQAIATAFRVNAHLDNIVLPHDYIRTITMQPIIRVNKDTGERDLVMAR